MTAKKKIWYIFECEIVAEKKKPYTKVDVPRIKNKMTNVCNKERIGNLFAYTLTENACLAVFFQTK